MNFDENRILIDEDPNGVLKTIECFALDMDGTVYLEDHWIEGALEFIDKLKSSNRKFIFITNNSSKNANVYIDRLEKMGLSIDPKQLVTSGIATIDYLQKNHPGQSVFLLGNDLLKAEFADAGIELTEDDPQMIVTAFDTTLDYRKMTLVCDFIRYGKPWIATHPDFNCPTRTGFIPDAGAIHAFIHASTGRMPDRVIGKPNKDIVDFMLNRVGSTREKTAVVGDRLYTDIAAGIDNGLTGILVLSGEATIDDLKDSPVHPHLIFTSVKQITPYL